MTKNMNLRAMEIFVIVVDKGSMADASKALGMTQSSISQQISNQEELFAVKLLDRSVRPLTPTPAGQLYYDHAIKTLDAATGMWNAMQKADQNSLYQIRVAVIDTLADTLIPALSYDLGKRYPAGRIKIWSGQTGDHRTALLERRTDLIITMDQMEDVDSMERYPLYREPFVLAIPATVAKEGDLLDVLVKKLPFIRYSPRLQIGQLIEQQLRRLRLNIPHRYELDTTRAIMPMVAAGRGWTLTTPTGLLDCRHFLENVKILPLPFTSFSRQISLVARDRELGNLPRQLALICQEHIKAIAMPQILSKLPPEIESVSYA
ncbi:LysR family transcriptional regulator [Kiloniella laminariae]|uniref:LysR family transcriptional regulator n=1 Tax=Kiloniella laminariae TaxID=454162 RepID=A0ABT4LN17_9PROT|nr:LysR family transcriptional regulator [Kiloniella laminariae]MCZ4282535.1 LysR family transcriptional regulator [Kiloniella laminariae]